MILINTYTHAHTHIYKHVNIPRIQNQSIRSRYSGTVTVDINSH
jgi:hypothetical protein